MSAIKYKYPGAGSLVELHERHLRQFIDAWHIAKQNKITLPATEDEDYVSLEALLFHVLRSARNYMVWMCEKLNLQEPDIKMPPAIEVIEKECFNYLTYLVEKWKTPLADVEVSLYSNKAYASHLGVPYSIEAMLEHAVMHPLRHWYQLAKLIQLQK